MSRIQPVSRLVSTTHFSHLQPVASSSRTYATKYTSASAGSSYMQKFAPTTDSRADVLRSFLYPPDAHLSKSSSPSGAHHPEHVSRIQAVIPSDEYLETIERAWKLYRRHKTDARNIAIRARFKSMELACDELDKLTKPVSEGGAGFSRRLYTAATRRDDVQSRERIQGRKVSTEQRWLETRLEGLYPRESWVPTETRGKGWNYDWKRPRN